MAFDYKKEYREYYLPKKKPSIVTIPPMYFASVCGQGDPNEENGAYKEAISKLQGIQCGGKPTSCPDQLSKALAEAMEKEQ